MIKFYITGIYGRFVLYIFDKHLFRLFTYILRISHKLQLEYNFRVGTLYKVILVCFMKKNTIYDNTFPDQKVCRSV